MTLLYRIRALMRWLFRRDEIERALDTDLADYIERSAAEKMRAGMSEAEARRAARIELGGVEQTKDSVRATLSIAAIDNTLADVGYALRTMRRQKTFTLVTVLTLALGLGATTAIFSVVNAVLLRPLPYAAPDRVVKIVENIPAEESPGGTPRRTSGISLDELDWWRTNSETLSHVAVSVGEDRTFTTPDGTVQLSGARVSAALFAIRGLAPLLGRGLLPEEERPDADVVVLSESMWREHFRSAPNVVGRTAQLDARSYTVVGVMPAEFGTQAFWLPFAVPPPEPGRTRMVQASARLRDGVSLEVAAAEANVIGMQLRGMSPPPEASAAPRFEIVREVDNLTASVVPALRVLVVAVAAVLLIVCTNVANLLLVRGTRRQHEIAIRRALGATRARIARHVLTESVVLASFGSLLGVALAYGGVQVLKTLGATRGGGRFAAAQTLLPRLEEISIDPAALFFVGALSIATPLVFGLLPALRLSRFGEHGGSAAQLSAVSGVTRIGHVLGTAQLAFAMTLLVGAGLLLHSFLKLASVDPGVDLRGVLSFDVAIPGDYTAQRRLQVVEEVVTRLQANPLVTGAGFTNLPPLVPGTSIFLSSFVPEGMTREEIDRDWQEQGPPQTRIVSSGYLRALGARLVAGRWLDEQESALTTMAALVSRPFAQHFLSARDPVGTVMQSRFGPVTIVGVVDDLHLGGLDAEPPRAVFLEARQVLARERPETADDMFLRTGGNGVPFAVRTTADPLALVADLRSIVRSVDAALVLDGVSPMEQVLSGLTARPRFYAILLGAFGAIAAFIAVIGIYGVLAYLVSQRTKEIGIRIALGAQQANVLRLVLRRGVAMISIGITAGVLGALGLTRYLSGMLYGITALDAVTYGVVAAAFATVALLASYVPARRASRIDPMTVLRYE